MPSGTLPMNGLWVLLENEAEGLLFPEELLDCRVGDGRSELAIGSHDQQQDGGAYPNYSPFAGIA